MEVGQSRRERKRDATRTALRAAAFELFAARGFDGATVEDIADAADVAPSTFFRHFPTKEDVVLADYPGRLSDLLRFLREQPTDLSLAEAMFNAVASWIATRRPSELLLAEQRLIEETPQLQARSLVILRDWERSIAEVVGERRGTPPTDLETMLVAGWFVATVRIIASSWTAGGGRGDPLTMSRRAMDTFTAAMAARLAASPSGR